MIIKHALIRKIPVETIPQFMGKSLLKLL